MMGLGGVLNNALVIIWFFMSTLGNAAFDGQQLTSFLNEGVFYSTFSFINTYNLLNSIQDVNRFEPGYILYGEK